MPRQPSFDEVLKEANKHWVVGTEEEYQIAYDLITESVPLLPDEPRIHYVCYNYRYCAAALLGKPDLAIEILQEAVEAGYWWTQEYLRSDEDLKSLQDLPAFNDLVEICEQKRRAASSGTKPLALPLPLFKVRRR